MVLMAFFCLNVVPLIPLIRAGDSSPVVISICSEGSETARENRDRGWDNTTSAPLCLATTPAPQ